MPGAAPTMVPAGPGRRYQAERVARLGDLLPSGEVRLDALATYLQDIAFDDGIDAEIDRHLAWVVRRCALRIYRRPTPGRRLALVTWASGTGGRWAERRTTISVGDELVVDAAAIWVCVDTTTVRPARLSDRFWEMYGESTGGRSVSSRLVHAQPPGDAVASARVWQLRLADLDHFGHVNNTVMWAAVEDEVTRVAPAAQVQWAEVEYRTPIDRDAKLTLASRVEEPSAGVWLLAEGGVMASAVVGLQARSRTPGGSVTS